MNSHLPFLSLSFLLFLSTTVFGQAPRPQRTAPKATATNSKDPAEEQASRERRAQARSLLVALSVDARTFRDQPLRARSLARIADALWQVDSEQARAMFRKAWEAAELADQESERKLQEEVQQQKTKTGGGFAINLPPNLRREVLRLVARHDRPLGEEFLDKLKKQEVADASQPVSRSSDSASQRLEVARELLDSGDSRAALQFAEAALSVVNMETIDFLSYVRDKDPISADARYLAMLASAAANPQSDANTVSLLSSYIFTPHLMITFSGNGARSSQSVEKIVPAEVPPELKSAFFQAAAGILLRPAPPPGADQSSGVLDTRYVVLKRLLPLFEPSAPPEMVATLRNQLEALGGGVSDNTRKRADEWMNAGIGGEKPAEDREQSLLDRIDRARTSEERDRLYIQLAFNSLHKSDLRAREFVSKVEDSELRKQAQSYIDPSLAIRTVEKKQTEQALELVRRGELSHLMKSWVLSEIAKQLVKSDRQKAVDLIEEAADEARRIDVSDRGLPQALLAVANALQLIDPNRAWDATFDAVKAANSADGFTGEDGELVLKFQSKGQSSISNHDVAEFDVDKIFRALASLDYERAVQLARGFQGEGPRAVATIAIARAILEPKKGSRN